MLCIQARTWQLGPQRQRRYNLVHLWSNACCQKNWKQYNATKVKSYFHCITASDEAFGLFLLKNYKDLPLFIKKPIWGQREQEDSSTKIKKEKLSGRKLWQAIQDYDLWLWQFKLLWKKPNPLESHIYIDINKHCSQILAETNSNPKKKCKHSYVSTNSLELAVDSLPFWPVLATISFLIALYSNHSLIAIW